MHRYRVVNQRTGEIAEVYASSAEHACRRVGWPLSACRVRRLCRDNVRRLRTRDVLRAMRRADRITDRGRRGPGADD